MMTKPDRSRRSTSRLATIVHELAGVVLARAAVEPRRKRERVGDIFRGGRREAIVRFGHDVTVTRLREQDKNESAVDVAPPL
jgi:hypothetical protein